MKILDEIFNNLGLSQSYIFFGDDIELINKFSLEFAYRVIGSKTNIMDSIIFLGNNIKSITINDIRFIKSEVIKKSIYHKNKVVLISNSERMSVEAQNAILKTLEDQSKNVFIVLILNDINKILDTIISRCIVINFNSILKSSENNFGRIYGGEDSEKIYELLINSLINFRMFKFNNFSENINSLVAYKNKLDLITDMMYIFIRDLFIYIKMKDTDIISNDKFLGYILELGNLLNYFNIDKSIFELEKFKSRVNLNINFGLSLRLFIFRIGGD
ncbi:DNA polymerase III subunit delta' [Candidatus Arthromitus sp. SFB-mouse-Japan]|uniref:DNA polymerase III subunit delta' n=1 Tax=Candidatus Arthromitus sp. SFB-mouse TaxID=49118 RepID=UPI00021B816B|nr:DNA polymerase III subunit delta' [Candidatus Arthromitus sp. SFB-mouse]EIA22405.1 DNA polymerase III, delta prime subunit [Candidatus Arthromitus sp. SFB-1]EIA22604.1 DNA polymerase III, delta prime subunit [Candidatus Arthromitus sp. SFB-3]EIA24930.1 DNA polymerase III, delta prime subunit [Candidatus Arthromitus sp. SFB-2]EIA26653.1 DNA polymerase III, delta prime subunit [Candidatus Arthromitus sp. SFB-4]EIA29391.1 DNA polymerase III, delta prime subunit [Candidatus Arthromitus sp. SFB-